MYLEGIDFYMGNLLYEEISLPYRELWQSFLLQLPAELDFLKSFTLWLRITMTWTYMHMLSTSEDKNYWT